MTKVTHVLPKKKFRFMPLKQVLKYVPQARKLNVSTTARGPRGFLTAYKRAKTRAKLSEYWIKKRRAFIKRHLSQYKKYIKRHGKPPVRQRLALIMWAYNPKNIEPKKY